MRRFPVLAILFVSFVLVSAGLLGCSRSSSVDSIQPGTQVTVVLKDGSTATGRFVQAKPDAVVIDPGDGGEWKTLPRDQVASVTPITPASAQGQTPAAQSPAAQPPSAPGAQPAPAGSSHNRTTPRASGRSPVETAPGSSASGGTAAPSKPSFREVTIAADSLVHAKLDTAVASDTSRVEDAVQATVSKPIVVDDVEAVPAGSVLRGVVTTATPAGKVKGRAEIGFKFDTLTSGGDQYRVKTRGVGIEAPATKKNDALKIGIPAAGGAILGGILGGGKGAAIGGAVGGGAGTAVVLTTPGKEVRLPAGTAVTVKLLEPLTVRVPIDR